MDTTVEEIAEKLSLIKRSGFIQSKRRGSTGVGHTLEQSLGLTENNFTVPDLGEVELKATRTGTNTPVTLFTLDRNAWQISQKDVISTYGIPIQDRINLYNTLSNEHFRQRLKIIASDVELSLIDDNDVIVAKWNFDAILDQFHQKVRHLILVQAESRLIDNKEFFRFHKATFHSGWLLRWHLPNLFNRNLLLLDLRMHLKNGRVRNHGTGFRISESNLHHVYPYEENLPL